LTDHTRLREMIEYDLDDRVDYHLAAEVLDRVRKGEEGIFSSARVRADLGLGDPDE
jgi:RHH-type rel operon transcriptional repressor/antitoxin RelB